MKYFMTVCCQTRKYVGTIWSSWAVTFIFFIHMYEIEEGHNQTSEISSHDFEHFNESDFHWDHVFFWFVVYLKEVQMRLFFFWYSVGTQTFRFLKIWHLGIRIFFFRSYFSWILHYSWLAFREKSKLHTSSQKMTFYIFLIEMVKK